MAFNYQSVPRGVRGIIVASVAVWILQLVPGLGPLLTQWFSLIPEQTFGHLQIWRLATYPFLHDPAGPFHLLFNMLTLWMFGTEIEELWGTGRFVRFYLTAGICSGLLSLLTVISPFAWMTPVIGASGAVIALLTVYAFMFPQRQILLFFLVPVNVLVAVAIFSAVSLFGSMQGWGNISHLTHLGGILVGVFYAKGFPFFASFLKNAKITTQTLRSKTAARQETLQKENYDNRVDRILKKISDRGIESLTKEEKETLEEASKRKRGSAGKILPFKRPE